MNAWISFCSALGAAALLILIIAALEDISKKLARIAEALESINKRQG